MNDCRHDWNTTSPLALVVQRPDDIFSALTGAPEIKIRVEYCRICGTVRLPEDQLASWRAAEGHAKAGGG